MRIMKYFKKLQKQLSKPLLTTGPSIVHQNHQNIVFLLLQFHAKNSILLKPLCSDDIYLSNFLFAYDITHDTRIRAQRIDFRKSLNVILRFESNTS